MPTVKKRIAKSTKRTADGRQLPRYWLEQAAASYKVETYAARVNLEHLRAYHPDSAFKSYGTVLGLSTEPADNGELYLVAEIDAGADLVSLWNQGQKRAFSVEIDPNFADVGGAYLVGLAVTDSPASLGTHFTQQFAFDPSSPPQEFTMPDPSAGGTATPTVPTPAAPAPAAPQPSPAPATPPAAFTAADGFTQSLQHFSAEITRLTQLREAAEAALAKKDGEYSAQLAAKEAEIADLKNQIPANGYTPRPLQTGQETPSASATDC